MERTAKGKFTKEGSCSALPSALDSPLLMSHLFFFQFNFSSVAPPQIALDENYRGSFINGIL